jgi:hypothetical protein
MYHCPYSCIFNDGLKQKIDSSKNISFNSLFIAFILCFGSHAHCYLSQQLLSTMTIILICFFDKKKSIYI